MKRLILFLPLILLFGCKKSINLNKRLINVYGSTININLYEGTKEDLEYISNLYTNYSKLSDSNYSYYGVTNVYDINEADINERVEISYELYELLSVAKEYYTKTNGYYNMAIGHASSKWKTSIENSEYVDLKTYLADNNLSIDINSIILNDESGYYVTKLDNVAIDLGGIAKGYANKKVLEYLNEKNITRYLINAGNSSILLGKNAKKDTFSVGLIDPLTARIDKVSKNYIIFEANNISITTSGNYESYFIDNNNLYHHILSNDLICKNYYNSLTIFTSDPCLGDVYSTTLYNLEIEDALKMCKDLSIQGIFYLYDGSVVKTEGFNYNITYEKA